MVELDRDEMSEVEFNRMMEKGLEQAKADESVSVSDAFASLRETEKNWCFFFFTKFQRNDVLGCN